MPEVIATFPGERTTPPCNKHDLRRLRLRPACIASPGGQWTADALAHSGSGSCRWPMSTLALLLTQCVNALSQAALLFFLGVGLTLIFGIMRIVNFAHGALYMLGAFVGYSLRALTGSFWVALVARAGRWSGCSARRSNSASCAGSTGATRSAFLMVTFGLALVVGEAIRLIWGSEALQVPAPPLLSGVVFLLDEPFPVYRLFLAGAGIVVAIAIWQFLERTRLGLLIRATSQNAEMVHALGTDVNLVRSGVFGIGCGLAALGGVLAAPLVTASLGMAATVIIDAFVIVIIGGMGSFLGSLIGALLVAFVQVFGNYYFPDFALAFMYLVMLAGAGRASRRPARQGGVSAMRLDRRARLSAVVVRCWSLAPLGLPPFAMTLLTEALILGLFAMSLDLMVGYTRLRLVRPRRGLRLRRLCLAAICCCTPACRCCSRCSLAGVADRRRGDRRRLGVHAGDRRLVLDADAGLRPAALRRRLQVDPVTGGSDGLAGIPRRPGPFGITRVHEQDRLLLSRARLPGRRVPVLPRRWCARRSARCCAASARTRPRRGARLQHAPLQDRRGGDLLRARRPGRRALCAVRRLRQHRAAVLAAVGPGADHGDRRRRRHADRPDPRRRLLHAGVETSSAPGPRPGRCSSA